jgi:predicted RNase H-like HicB family nuclease
MNDSPSKRARVQAQWDDEVQVWIATSCDISGLVIEADTIEKLRLEIDLILPDLIELNHDDPAKLEYHLECSTPKMPSPSPKP